MTAATHRVTAQDGAWLPRITKVGLLALSSCQSSAWGSVDAGAPGDLPIAAAIEPPLRADDAGPEPRAGAPAASASVVAPPLAATVADWRYNALPQTQCRDGSTAGVAVNLGQGSKKLMIYLDGGGWCIDELSCSMSPANVDEHLRTLGLLRGTGGIFNRLDARNPARDWNYVFVPYCTGDLHSGANPNAHVEGVGPQKFVGYLNMQAFLVRIAATFPDASDVLLIGESAGGLGVWGTSVLVQSAFPNVRVKLISDAGPPASSAIFPECLQERQRRLFKLDETFLAECGASCPNPSDFWSDFGLFVVRSFQDRPSGLVISQYDFVIRSFFGTGNDGCTGTFDLLNPGVSPEALRGDLVAFRERVKGNALFGTFYPNSQAHTWTSGIPGLGLTGSLFDGNAGGVPLVDWLSRLLDGQTPGHAGP